MKLDANLVARGWLDLQSLDLDSEEYRTGSWAFDVVLHALMYDGPYLLEIIEQILVVDAGGEYLEALAVGILDNFLSTFGAVLMDRFEATAVKDGNLRKALKFVSPLEIESDVWARVQILASK